MVRGVKSLIPLSFCYVLQRCSFRLRKSSNGRRAVSKTVNVGSIPAFRAVTMHSFQSDFGSCQSRILAAKKEMK